MNLFTLFAKLGLDSSEYEKGLKKAQKSAQDYKSDVMKLASQYKKAGLDSSAAMKKAYAEVDKSQYEFSKSGQDSAKLFSLSWDNAGKSFLKIGKIIGQVSLTFTGIAATGITMLSKLAVENYSEYEQLAGGVDTLFKDSSAKLKQYAANAYATAEMDANSFMQNVTSFSASLISSLAGDTDKATDIANMALVDISDNANKMGTAQESLVLAYQGFAKQQYQLLDNLKLGYGGTRGEMERLLKDAEKISGIKYDISNLADVYSAIHVIQEELGIANATKDEALTTIAGSANAAKAAWQNLLIGIADPTQDLEMLIGNFVDSAVTFTDNLLPILENSLNGIVNFIDKGAPLIIARLPELVKKVLPGLVRAAINLVEAAGEEIPDLLIMLLDLLEAETPTLLKSAFIIITALLQGLTDATPEFMEGAIGLILSLAHMLTDPSNLVPLVSAGLDLIVALAFGIVDALPELREMAPQIIGNLVVSILSLVPELIDAGFQLIAALFKGMFSFNTKGASQRLASGISADLLSAQSQFSATADAYSYLNNSNYNNGIGGIETSDQTFSVGEQTFNLQVGEETISTVVVDIMKKEARMG